MRRCSGLGLIPAVLAALSVPATAAPRAVFVASYHWQGDHPRFGGFSGLDIAEDGSGFAAVSDSAAIVTGRLVRDVEGAVIGVEAEAPRGLATDRGQPLVPPFDDAEGVTLIPGGGYYISYEIEDRIERYATDSPIPVTTFRPGAFRGFTLNAGIEALAIDADAALYAIPELPVDRGGDFPVYRYLGGQWQQPFSMPRHGSWRPVGADFGPDGRLYVLERDFWGLIGFMTRIRRLTIEDNGIAADEVLFESRAGHHDNLEGIAVWRDASGVTRLTMVSDDNFLPLQRTEIVDYRVEE